MPSIGTSSTARRREATSNAPYGPPNATSFANAQNDIWIYRWARSTARAESFIPYVGAFVGGSDVQKKELVILFNEQNMVVRHSMRG